MKTIVISAIIVVFALCIFYPALVVTGMESQVLYCGYTVINETHNDIFHGRIIPMQDPGPTIIVGNNLDGSWLEVGDKAKIQWTTTGGTSPLKVTIEYSTDDIYGKYTLIKENLPGNSSYIWTVPPRSSVQCFIKATVIDCKGLKSYDYNDHEFYIMPSTKIGLFTGKVVDINGKAIGGATLLVREAGKSIYSESNGTFSEELPLEIYTVDVSKDGYFTNTTYVTLAGLGDTPIFYTIQLKRGIILSPTVVAGISLFTIFILFCIVVFYALDRKRKRWYEQAHPKKKRPMKNDAREDENFIDRLWAEDNENTSNGKNKDGNGKRLENNKNQNNGRSDMRK